MPTNPSLQASRLSTRARLGILAAAFLGWFFGGSQIAVTNLIQAGVLDVLDQAGWMDLATYRELSRKEDLAGAEAGQFAEWKALVSRWYAWLQCAFLFGAAAGGYVFGKLGDRLGRSRALGTSILWFSLFTGLTWFAQSPEQLLVLRFLACLGIGGTWPNGVALVAEVWSDTARPVLASAIGMAGNLGIFAMSALAKVFAEHDVSWKWGMLVNASPILLGLLILALLPESPAWRANAAAASAARGPRPSVFRRPYLGVTLVGIALATVPLIGGWGSANWMIPWAGDIGRQSGDPSLAPRVIMVRSLASIVGSMLAGLIAVWLGRRRTYLISCLSAFLAAQCAFWFTIPGDAMFFVWILVLGLFNGIFFGWLPFFLPELFPTAVRSTGAGVSFNYGRILTAVTLFATGYLSGLFDGDYAAIGKITSFVFLLGVLAIIFAPDTSMRNMEE